MGRANQVRTATFAAAVALVTVWSATAQAATINGTSGADFIKGTNANDNLNGNGGADVIIARRGFDFVVGSGVITLGGGEDTLTVLSASFNLIVDDEGRTGGEDGTLFGDILDVGATGRTIVH